MTPAIDRLGDTIRAARMKKGYTQETFAEMLDITPFRFGQHRRIPSETLRPPPFSNDDPAGLFGGRPGVSSTEKKPGSPPGWLA